MKKTVTLLFILTFLGLNAQRLKTEMIIEQSEMILRNIIGQDLIKYFAPTEGISFYRLKENRFGFVSTKKLKKNGKTRRKWIEIWVHWRFEYPSIQGLSSALWIKLDKNLNPLEPLELNIIPDFIWNNKPSNFISINDAEKIGERNLTRTNFGIDDLKLSFDSKLNMYVYEICNKKTQDLDSDGKKHGVLEIIKISALTGEVIEIIDGYYGKTIIR